MAITDAQEGSKRAYWGRMQEYVFLTRVYGFTDWQAQQQLGVADETARRWRARLRKEPEIAAEVIAVYNDDGEVLA